MSYGRTILRIAFGAHLYGTETPTSDLDYKSVYVPNARDILLGRVKGAISAKRPKAEGEKNYAGEIDEEAYSLQRYLGLIAEGQTVALDVLFAPPQSFVDVPEPEWQEIVANRHRLVSRKSAAFVGYVRQQAQKYGIKGSRVAAARAALNLLDAGYEEHGSLAKLSILAPIIEPFAGLTDHVVISDQTLPSGTEIRHLDVCGRKLPYTSSIKNGREILQKLVDEYGRRALQAESQQGVDWKALSHAVRVATQALELFGTGRVTFPLPNREHVMAIKQGRLRYQDVAAEIEDLLVVVEEAAARSSLPDHPDRQWIDDFVAHVYKDAVTRDVVCQ